MSEFEGDDQTVHETEAYLWQASLESVFDLTRVMMEHLLSRIPCVG